LTRMSRINTCASWKRSLPRPLPKRQEGNILSAVLRQAWDHGALRILVSGRQKAPIAATDAHVSVIAHITADEVRRLLTETEAVNGFENRFLWGGCAPFEAAPAWRHVR